MLLSQFVVALQRILAEEEDAELVLECVEPDGKVLLTTVNHVMRIYEIKGLHIVVVGTGYVS